MNRELASIRRHARLERTQKALRRIRLNVGRPIPPPTPPPPPPCEPATDPRPDPRAHPEYWTE